MKARVLSAVVLPAGTRLVLNPDQVRRRRNLLMQVGKDLHQATAPVQFKAGELIGIEGDVDKVTAMHIEILGGAPAQAPAARHGKRKAALLSAPAAAPAARGADE